MKKKPPNITDEEKKIFRDAMRDVEPLSKRKQRILSPKQFIERKKQHVDNDDQFAIKLEDSKEYCYQANDFLSFARSGIQTKRLRLLRHGKIPIEAIIDLHGKTTEQAKKLLQEFLTAALLNNERCVQIIHGKGQHRELAPAILKNKVYGWLEECSYVLAFCSCLAKHGGTGALYVLLKAI